MKNKTGKFFGIGVGPGDPELISLRAVHILGGVHTIFAAASSKNIYSLAMRIARPHLPKETPVLKLSFPMTSDRETLRLSWRKNAAIIVEELEKGKDAAFITLGDPLTYSTYGYVIREIKKIAPHIEIETIPGITSYQAAAARTNLPLAEGEESLLIVSGSHGVEKLRRLAKDVDNIVLLKTYRNFPDIYSALDEAGLVENATGVSHCGHPEEKVIPDISEMLKEKPHYFTLLLIKKEKMEP